MMGNFHEILNFNQLILTLNPIHLQLTVGSPHSLIGACALWILKSLQTNLKDPCKMKEGSPLGFKTKLGNPY